MTRMNTRVMRRMKTMRIKNSITYVRNKYALTANLITDALDAANKHLIRMVIGIVTTTDIQLPFELTDSDVTISHSYNVSKNVATVIFMKGNDKVVIIVPYMDDHLTIKVNKQFWLLNFDESDVTLGQRNELYRITHYLFNLNLTNSHLKSLTEKQ